MKSITIKGSKRESVGKVATKALRNAGMVPCVIYGGEKPVHFSAEEKAFKKLVYTPDVFTASLDVDGQKTTAILQDIQFHPVSDRILHVDFYQLFDDKEVTMNIPVKLTGTSPGVLNGGSLRFTNRKLKIKALPANLPDYVTADISELKIGSKLLVTSLFNDEYTFMHPDNTVVVQVRTSRNATAEEEEEVTEEATEASAPAAE
ncbi:50S ribosomal protein L25/general stress protein Ctc [Polaribacter sp.]|nr:50S ribosomal protein L25/general stress protein Ctc [Polaribacter sp.]MDA9092839.1 50S ribosomal protein L25/general stress protein Ctc [Polaribacter sp.]MDB4010158.1 50S ribosomal protein L25/general stress protein Ctc [Polaribacter sp.]MDB4182685.1 50S ribosomal protein L25/general stress protein Ctc [Polaribacter sp.]